MKSFHPALGVQAALSLPSRGAWIEIVPEPFGQPLHWSLPSRGAWIEIGVSLAFSVIVQSLPSRGAWIVITVLDGMGAVWIVAPLTGSVD